MEEIKREVIKKHLEGWERDLKNTSIEHFAKSGKVSGSFFMALKDMLDDYVEQLRIHDVGNRRELLCDFFKYFRDNGEANIGMTIEEFVDGFLKTQ